MDVSGLPKSSAEEPSGREKAIEEASIAIHIRSVMIERFLIASFEILKGWRDRLKASVSECGGWGLCARTP